MKGFRVYDKSLGEYVTDKLCWLVDSAGELCTIEDGELKYISTCIKEDDTGFVGKNWVKIFEGDVVSAYGVKDLGEVVFHNSQYKVLYTNKKGRKKYRKMYNGFFRVEDDIHNYKREKEKNYSSAQKRQMLEKMCEICAMGTRISEDYFECSEGIFPCSKVKEAFKEVIKILEE